MHSPKYLPEGDVVVYRGLFGGYAILRSLAPPSAQLDLAAMMGWANAEASLQFHVEPCLRTLVDVLFFAVHVARFLFFLPFYWNNVL